MKENREAWREDSWGEGGGGLGGPVMQQTTTYTKITFKIPFTKTQPL